MSIAKITTQKSESRKGRLKIAHQFIGGKMKYHLK